MSMIVTLVFAQRWEMRSAIDYVFEPALLSEKNPYGIIRNTRPRYNFLNLTVSLGVEDGSTITKQIFGLKTASKLAISA